MADHVWVVVPDDSYPSWKRLPDGSIGDIAIFAWRCSSCGSSTTTTVDVPEGRTYRDVDAAPPSSVVHDLIEEDCLAEVVKRVHEH